MGPSIEFKMQRCRRDATLIIFLVANVLCAVVVICLCVAKRDCSSATCLQQNKHTLKGASTAGEKPHSPKNYSSSDVTEAHTAQRRNVIGKKHLEILQQAFVTAHREATRPPLPNHDDNKKTPFYYNTLKPLIHLSGTEHEFNSKYDNQLVEVGDWRTRGNGRKVRNGLEPTEEKKRLVIPRTGVYKLYASMKFCANDTTNATFFEACLYRQSAIDYSEEELLCHSHALGNGRAVSSSPDTREYGTYTLVVTPLNVRDEVYVKVKYNSALRAEMEWHYIGAHLLE